MNNDKDNANERTAVEADGDAGKTPAMPSVFLRFISGLAGQTLMHLGVMQNPLTKQSNIDLPNAHFSIDILTALQEKTQGNLTEEEDAYLRAAVHDLQVHFLRVTNGTSKA